MSLKYEIISTTGSLIILIFSCISLFINIKGRRQIKDRENSKQEAVKVPSRRQIKDRENSKQEAVKVPNGSIGNRKFMYPESAEYNDKVKAVAKEIDEKDFTELDDGFLRANNVAGTGLKKQFKELYKKENYNLEYIGENTNFEEIQLNDFYKKALVFLYKIALSPAPMLDFGTLWLSLSTTFPFFLNSNDSTTIKKLVMFCLPWDFGSDKVIDKAQIEKDLDGDGFLNIANNVLDDNDVNKITSLVVFVDRKNDSFGTELNELILLARSLERVDPPLGVRCVYNNNYEEKSRETCTVKKTPRNPLSTLPFMYLFSKLDAHPHKGLVLKLAKFMINIATKRSDKKETWKKLFLFFGPSVFLVFSTIKTFYRSEENSVALAVYFVYAIYIVGNDKFKDVLYRYNKGEYTNCLVDKTYIPQALKCEDIIFSTDEIDSSLQRLCHDNFELDTAAMKFVFDVCMSLLYVCVYPKDGVSTDSQNAIYSFFNDNKEFEEFKRRKQMNMKCLEEIMSCNGILDDGKTVLFVEDSSEIPSNFGDLCVVKSVDAFNRLKVKGANIMNNNIICRQNKKLDSKAVIELELYY